MIDSFEIDIIIIIGLSLEVGSYFFDIGCSDKSLIINGVRIDSIGESGMIRSEVS